MSDKLTVGRAVQLSNEPAPNTLEGIVRFDENKPSDADALRRELDEARGLVLDLFSEACQTRDRKYDHGFISTYEYVQSKLIEWGLIKASDCIYAPK